MAIRTELAAGTGLSEKALPFAAELIEVDPAEARWTGAIERVLRPMALTVLVRSENLSAVRTWVDAHRIRGSPRVRGDPAFGAESTPRRQ